MPNVYIAGGESRVWSFPGGEIGAEVVSFSGQKGGATIMAHIQSSDDVMSVLMLNDALKRGGAREVSLTMPYVPYARQDRVCNQGEALSIKVFADLINSCKFKSVTILDPHSDVTPALLDNCTVFKTWHVFHGHIQRRVLGDTSDLVVIAPDAGALKKTEEFAKVYDVKGVVVANKKRNVKTGEIEYVTLSESVRGERVLVLDDICDGGYTFLKLAEDLQDAVEMNLYVTHGIFSKGVDTLLDVYDNVITTNSFHRHLESRDNLHVIKV